MLGALAQIVPDRVPAAGEGGNTRGLHRRLRPQPRALHHRRHDQRRLGRAPRQGRHRGGHQPVAEHVEHAGRDAGGAASDPHRGVRASCRTAAAPGAGAAGSACGARTACWPTRRCCSCAPTGSSFRPTGSPAATPGGVSRNVLSARGRARAAAGQGHHDASRRATSSPTSRRAAAATAIPSTRDPALVRETSPTTRSRPRSRASTSVRCDEAACGRRGE